MEQLQNRKVSLKEKQTFKNQRVIIKRRKRWKTDKQSEKTRIKETIAKKNFQKVERLIRNSN